jgi:transposase
MTHLIVNVETTPATTPDDNMIKEVHESLERRDLLPGEHLVDKGYTDAHVLVESQRAYGVTIVGPVAEDPSWQARAGEGFDKKRVRQENLPDLLLLYERAVLTDPQRR